MQEKLIQTNIVIQGTHYPWGVYIGELYHPTGGKFYPAVIPSDSHSLLINYSKKDKHNVAHICEDISAHFLLSLVHNQSPKINIIDKSLYNVFPNIMQLNNQKNISIFSNEHSIDKFNQSLIELVRERSYNLLNENITSIYQYNEHVDPRAQENYILNIINLNDYSISSDRLDFLNNIIYSSYSVGVKFIFYFDRAMYNNFIDSCEEDKKRKIIDDKMSKLLIKLPSLNLSDKDIFLNENHPLFSKLNELIKNNKLTIGLSQRDDNRHIFNQTVRNLKDEYRISQNLKPKSFLKIEVGVTPNGREKCYFELGARNQSYHAFMIGINGSGKTTLLDHIIKGIVSQFTPEQAELYLFDYKEGVEFQKYLELPHVRVLMLDNSQIDPIINSLKKFSSLIKERGILFKQKNVKNIEQYNKLSADSPLSRSYLIIDEVQCLFEHSRSPQIEKLLIDLAKRGRAFGLHMIMSTQTLTGYTISSELLTQFKMRVSFNVNTSDSMKIFMVGNEEPVYLKPYQFILNDEMGIKESNQRILMNKPTDDILIQEIANKYKERNYTCVVINESSSEEDIHKQDNLENKFMNYSYSGMENDNTSLFNGQNDNKEEDNVDTFIKELESNGNYPPEDTDWEVYFDKHR